MNPASLAEAKLLFGKVSRTAGKLRNVETVMCPPFIYLSEFAGRSKVLGAQDVFWQNDGRFTGEISPKMLKSVGVSYVIVGHSERRSLGETDAIVAHKALGALGEGLKTVICVGEGERDLGGAYFEFLKIQIKQSLAGIPRRFLPNLIIAYEPLWAVGKSYKDAMTPADIRETSIFIRKILSDIYDQTSVVSVPIIYGGAVETENIADVLREGGVAGVLVGHKSVVADEFISMIKSANDL